MPKIRTNKRSAENPGSDADDDEIIVESPSKKLRSSDCDLKVIINYRNDKTGEAEQKEYLMYGQILSSLSKFVDTCLSVDMKEKETGEITFHDVTPEVFELAIKYQTDHLASRSMSSSQAVKVVKFYHQYEFTGGLALCDHVLWNCFKKQLKCKSPPSNLDFLVDTAVLIDELDLEKSGVESKVFLCDALYNCSSSPVNVKMFKLEHVKKMHPMFKKGLFADAVPTGTTEEELHSACFPRYFLSHHCHYHSILQPRTITVFGSNSRIDGDFTLQEDHTYLGKIHDNDRQYCIRKEDDSAEANWVIAREGKCLWKSPYSQNLKVPPREPWVKPGERTKVAEGPRPYLEYYYDSRRDEDDDSEEDSSSDDS